MKEVIKQINPIRSARKRDSVDSRAKSQINQQINISTVNWSKFHRGKMKFGAPQREFPCSRASSQIKQQINIPVLKSHHVRDICDASPRRAHKRVN